MSSYLLENLRNVLGHFHPALVHFPLGLLLTGAGVELWCVLRRRKPSSVSMTLARLGFVAAVLAAGSGFLLLRPGDFRGLTLEVVELHRNLGFAAVGLSVSLVLAAGRKTPESLQGSRRLLYRGFYFLTALVIALAGHYGAWVVFGWGKIWIL